MATSIQWFGGDFVTEIQPAESGEFDTLGFFGGGFGLSIRVGEYNDNSFATNDDGTAKTGPALPNTKFASNTGVYTPGMVNARLLTDLEEAEATLAIRLNTDNPVITQNAAFRCFDRVDIDNGPSGIICYSAEVIKDTGDPAGSGDSTWTQVAGTGSLTMDDQSLFATQHVWYVAVTVSPQSIGEKTNVGFYFETEFL